MKTPLKPKPMMWGNSLPLALICTLLAGGLSGSMPAQNTSAVIANDDGFACDIPGCADASKNIREIAIDELNIDIRETTTGLDVEYRRFQPGQPHFGNATFTCALGAGKELQAWFQEAATGKNIRKNISVTLFKSDKSAGRGYTLFDCFPTAWSVGEPDATGVVQTETLTVNIGRIEFKGRVAPPAPGGPGGPRAQAAVSDQFAQVRGFKVEITGSSGKEVDTAWESVSGGDRVFLLENQAPRASGNNKFATNSPGHKSVGDITLRGAMTDGRQALCQWINDTVKGKPWKRDLTITELLSVGGALKPGKSYTFHDCFPVSYVFPRMSVTNTTGNVMEEVTFRVVRYDQDFPPHTTGRLTIPDAPIASAQAPYIAVGDMGMDLSLIPVTGDARNPSAVVVIPQQSDKELRQWLDATAQGLGKPRTLTIDLLNMGRFTGRQMILWDCLPQSITPVPGPGVAKEELSIKFIRVELK